MHPGDVKGPTNPTWFGRWELPSNENKMLPGHHKYNATNIKKIFLALCTFDLPGGGSVFNQKCLFSYYASCWVKFKSHSIICLRDNYVLM